MKCTSSSFIGVVSRNPLSQINRSYFQIASSVRGHVVYFPAAAFDCSPACAPNGFCQERDGPSECVCNPGFQGDGRNCTGSFLSSVFLFVEEGFRY